MNDAELIEHALTEISRVTFEAWWMDWAFRHSKPQSATNYTLGDAVRAAFRQGILTQLAAVEGYCKARRTVLERQQEGK